MTEISSASEREAMYAGRVHYGIVRIVTPWDQLPRANPTNIDPSPPAPSARAGRDRFSLDLPQEAGSKGVPELQKRARNFYYERYRSSTLHLVGPGQDPHQIVSWQDWSWQNFERQDKAGVGHFSVPHGNRFSRKVQII